MTTPASNQPARAAHLLRHADRLSDASTQRLVNDLNLPAVEQINLEAYEAVADARILITSLNLDDNTPRTRHAADEAWNLLVTAGDKIIEKEEELAAAWRQVNNTRSSDEEEN